MTLQMINMFSKSLEKGPQFGLGILYPAPGIIERIGPDWDWIWIDGQHGNLDYHDILAAVRACNLIQRPSIVRVPGLETGYISKVLDTAAEGVMVPMINDAEQAYEAVKAAKFAPLGNRSFGGRRTVDLDGRGYANRDVAEPLLICQIETPAGLRNTDAIAGVEGVDVLFFGPDDMRVEAGFPMDENPPDGYFSDAIQMIVDAAKSHNIIAGGVFTTPESIRESVELGYKLIVSASDVHLLATGSKKKAQTVHKSITNKNI